MGFTRATLHATVPPAFPNLGGFRPESYHDFPMPGMRAHSSSAKRRRESTSLAAVLQPGDADLLCIKRTFGSTHFGLQATTRLSLSLRGPFRFG